MDVDWVMSSLYYVSLAFMYGSVLYMAIYELASWLCRRWRRRVAAQLLLDSVPDVPYLPLPDYQQAASGGCVGGSAGWPSPSSCVICIAEYGRGEGCFVMPGCGHAFHRACIAKWLRQGSGTCPICRTRAIPFVPPPPPPPAATEGEVAVVSTAEDMV